MADESPEAGSGDGEEYADDLEAFLAGKEAFLRTLAKLDEGEPEYEILQIKAMNRLFQTLAPYDPQEALKKQAFGLVKREIEFMDLKRAEKDYDKIAAKVNASEGDGRPHITRLLREHVTTIEKLSAGETASEATYRFNFDSGESLVVDSETLYSPTEFRRAYNGVFDVLPVYDGGSDDGIDEEWEDLLHDLQQARLVVKEDAVGPRTAAIRALRNHIATLPAYLAPKEAAERNGVLLDLDPEELERDDETGRWEAEADIVWVPSEEIAEVCDEADISVEALRVEMDNRDLRVGTSEEYRIGGGRKSYFWPLPREGDDGFREKLIEHEPAEGDRGADRDREPGDGTEEGTA